MPSLTFEECGDDAAQGSATAATTAQVVATAVRICDQSEGDAEEGDGMKNLTGSGRLQFHRKQIRRRQSPSGQEEGGAEHQGRRR